MECFRAIGRAIEAQWDGGARHPEAFAELATRALSEFDAGSGPSVDDIVRWVMRGSEGVRQGPLGFGQPPVRLFQGRNFRIEALFWLEASTDIHQHGFSGAFTVLAGASLHSTFEFELHESVGPRLGLGTLQPRRVEALGPGDVRTIHGGNRLIHAVFHLDAPTVSLVVRTEDDGLREPQFSYLRPGLAYDPHHRCHDVAVRLAMLRLLQRTHRERLLPAVVERIERADPWEAFEIMRFVADDGDDATFAAGLDRLAGVHPRFATALADALQTRSWERNIQLRRGLVLDPDHRFLMGLLLYAPSRAHLLRVVADARPGCDPVDRVLGWVEALLVSGQLGLRLEGLAAEVFPRLVRSNDDARVREELAGRHGEAFVRDHADEISQLLAGIRSVPITRVLFANG